MALYHFSENPGIRLFVPRQPSWGNPEPVVWAIDEWHAPMYYLPRDCPRVCFWPLAHSAADDVERLFGHTNCKMVIAVEAAWLDQIRTTRLYRYWLPESTFACQDAGAGYFVSRQTVKPAQVDQIDDLLSTLIAARVELRICPSIVALGKTVQDSTLHYSCIRMRNAVK